MLHRAPIVVFTLAVAAAAVGCAGPASRLRVDNARLAADNDRLRAELRRERRAARDLQTENLVLRDRVETWEVGAGRVGDVPRLPVEVLAPDDADGAPGAARDDGGEVVATTDDGTEIVYVGDAAAGRSVDAPDDLELEDVEDLKYAPDDDDDDDDDDDEPPPSPPRAAKRAPAPTRPPPRPSTRPSARPDAAATTYEAAVAKVRAKDHAGAVAALRAFLVAHPRHELADNAQYWLGEVYYDQKDYPRAIVEFRATIEGYPRGNKAPDALLKLGYCFAALGQRDKARAALEQVVESYPRTPPAELAARKLGELR